MINLVKLSLQNADSSSTLIRIHVVKLGWSALHKMSNFSPHKGQNNVSNVSKATKIKSSQNAPHFKSIKQILNSQK